MTTATSMMDEMRLARSRDFCEELTRRTARNFYYGLRLLPAAKRSAMFTLYAYMRLIDDIVDDEDGRPVSQRALELENWRIQTEQVLNGGLPNNGQHEVWMALSDVVRRHGIPARIFADAIAGQRQDLEKVSFESFADLHTYCYRVAGTVGVASTYIWGFEGGAATEAMAVDRGVAFQLTNILRDLCEDAQRGRVYLPKSELAAAEVTEGDLRSRRGGAGFAELMRQQIERAQDYYERSARLEERIECDSRAALIAMTGIYRGLLDKIVRDPLRVLRERVSLSLFTKLHIGWQAVRAARAR